MCKIDSTQGKTYLFGSDTTLTINKITLLFIALFHPILRILNMRVSHATGMYYFKFEFGIPDSRYV